MPSSESLSQALKGKTILLTGGTGFIGTRVAERLMLEYNVKLRVLVRKFQRAIPIARWDTIEMVAGSLLNIDDVRRAVQGCNIIINCAHDFTLTFPRKNRRENVQSAMNLATAALESGARVVHLSSADTFGRPNVERIDESTPRSPRGSAYARTKWAVEKAMMRRYRRDGLRLTVILPMIVYGPFGAWVHSPCDGLRTGRLALPGEGQGICNAIYVDDLVTAMLLAAVNDNAIGEQFVVNGADTPTWEDFYGGFDKALGVNNLALMTDEDFAAAVTAQARERKLLPVLAGILKDGTALGVLKKLRRSSMFDAVLKGGIKSVGEFLFLVPGLSDWDDRVRRYVRKKRYGRPRRNVEGDTRPLILPPNRWAADLYRCRARVNHEKAQRILGYTPAFDLKRGMDLVAQYIEYAYLDGER